MMQQQHHMMQQQLRAETVTTARCREGQPSSGGGGGWLHVGKAQPPSTPFLECSHSVLPRYDIHCLSSSACISMQW
jgi:hypothetical protein